MRALQGGRVLKGGHPEGHTQGQLRVAIGPAGLGDRVVQPLEPEPCIGFFQARQQDQELVTTPPE